MISIPALSTLEWMIVYGWEGRWPVLGLPVSPVLHLILCHISDLVSSSLQAIADEGRSAQASIEPSLGTRCAGPKHRMHG
jgi:hypothetical protein